MEKKPGREAWTPPKHQKKVQVRFVSDEIHASMVRLAKEDNRSLNGEIMQAFREFIKTHEQANKPEGDDNVQG